MPDRRPAAWWWFLVPLFTCGIGSFVMVLIGGLKLRSRCHTVAAAMYFNHVPAGYLVSELDLTPELAAEIVSQRDRCGGFSGPEELVVCCEAMTPQRLEIIHDHLVFIPVA